MAKRTIETNLDPKGNKKRSITVTVDFPDTLGALVNKFGELVVYDKFVDAHDVALQAFIRTQMGKTGDKRMDDKAIQKAVNDWKPSIRNKADPAKKVEIVTRIADTMSKEDRAALIKMLQASLK